ncbi:hypothetical protein [Niastella sp. OAS944]|uniref:hypothetical protein n=1 Tax=Niastella sp. OAS944 TaxID=2664089 RepID=UPI0034807175|nr:hypothetical protein [Chitinophagaceae bacterium OAS944]
MKKSLIPILSLLFIISLDSCKKDSDKQPEDTTRVVKVSNYYTGSNGDEYDATILEYDKSGRVISLKDTSDPSSGFTVSYVGDEIILQQAQTQPGSNVYSARYKLNSNYLPIQRITADGRNDMTATNPSFVLYADTTKFEYDAAGLLVKATGAGYDTTWAKYSSTQTYISASRKVYTISYTNNDGKLMAVNINEAETYRTMQVGSNNSSSSSAYNNEEIYSFEYTKNYANKVDKINAWLFAELGLLYKGKIPMIKYANLPDKMSRIRKTTHVASGSTNTIIDEPRTTEVQYLPSGYISSITYTDKYDVDKYNFTYNNQ